MTTKQASGGEIFKKIPAIMKELPVITKGRKNTQQGYAFRGIDDVYNFIQPLLAKHGVFMSAELLDDRHEERISKGGSAMMYRVLKMRYSFIAEDGSSISTDSVGEGMDSSDKASAKALSIAQKYAILQMFLVPTEEPKPEPENDSHEVEPKPADDYKKMTAGITELQRRELDKLLKDLDAAGIDPAEKSDKVLEHFEVGSLGELTAPQADAVIKKWTAALKAKAKS